jgi:pimeloyl-ACP methyl ester carboxylesterase
VRSPVPTLLLTGRFDPVAPPSEGRRAAATLSRSFFLEFPGVGH